MMNKRIVTNVFLFFSLFNLFSYDFESLKRMMFQNNPEILTLTEEYNRSELDVKDAYGGFGPSIDLQLSATYMVNPPINEIYVSVDDIINSISWLDPYKPITTGQRIKVYDGMDNTLYGIQFSLMQPLFTWGKLTNALKLYKQISQIKLTQIELKERELETELEIRVVSLIYLNRINQIIEEEKKYIDRLIEVSEIAEKSGMLLHEDVVDARIKGKELEIAQIELQDQISNQILEIQRSTGVEDFGLENLEYEVDEEKIFSILAQDKKMLEENALSGKQLSIKLVTQYKEMSGIAEKIAQGAVYWKPDIALQLSGGYGGFKFPFFESGWQDKDDYSFNISIGIKTTVWDGGKKLRDVKRRASETKSAEIKQADVRSSIKKTFNEIWTQAESCKVKIEYQALKIESAESKIKQKEMVYQTGYGSENDVLTEKIDRCNQMIEREKQALACAQACMTIRTLAQ